MPIVGPGVVFFAGNDGIGNVDGGGVNVGNDDGVGDGW